MLDVALLHIIEKRLLNEPKEAEEFLGINDDGRAPARSLGARIQLAILLGVIQSGDAKVLRAFKSIRNKFAHKVDMQLTDASLVAHLKTIRDYLLAALGRDPRTAEGVKTIASFTTDVTAHPLVAKFIMETGLIYLQEALDNRVASVKRIGAT
jgi:hypothetical protein